MYCICIPLLGRISASLLAGPGVRSCGSLASFGLKDSATP